MSEPEFSRTVDVRQCDGQRLEIAADESERAALAKRFDLLRVESLTADLVLSRKDRVVLAEGTMEARWVQTCAISAEDLEQTANERVALRFVPREGAVEGADEEEEIEITAGDLDEIDYTGQRIDVGEAIAQSLGLAIDPYAAGPEADAARAKLGEDEANPFGALRNML